MTPIRPYTAKRLGLRRSRFIVVAEIVNTPKGTLRAVCTDRSRRSFIVDAKGSAVHNSGAVIGAGQVKDERGRWQTVRPHGL